MTFNTPGQFVWHCHIVEHEDNEMMRPFRARLPRGRRRRERGEVGPVRGDHRGGVGRRLRGADLRRAPASARGAAVLGVDRMTWAARAAARDLAVM